MFDALVRRQSCHLLNRFTPVFQKSYSNTALVQLKPRLKSLEKIDRFRKKKEFEEYFIENLFLNKFQVHVLEYPEIRTLKEIASLKKHCKILKHFLDNESKPNETVRAPDKSVSIFKKLELSGYKLPLKNNGYGYLETEYTYVHEILSEMPSLSKTVAENEDFGIQLIHLFGNSLQKEHYLQKLASGESLSCFAHLESEPLASLDPIQVTTTASMTSDGKSYIISGKKNWVYNAIHADVMIFSANVVTDGEDGQKKSAPTLFLVDKNMDGIKVHEPIETVGLKGVDVCEVTFDRVSIPTNCVLGNVAEGDKLIKQIFSNGKLHSGAQCITQMKKLINLVIKHCIRNNFFNKSKYEREHFKIKVGHIVSRLYAVESMTYLVTGRLDSFENSNVFLESLILKIFASESLQYVLQQSLAILGVDYYSGDNSLKETIMDAQSYAAFDDANDYLRLVLGSAGCRHVLKYRKQSSLIQKAIDTLNKQNILYWANFKTRSSSSILKGYLHLMFESESVSLEECTFDLKESVNYLLKKHGENIFNKQIELKLLADIVIDIYTMTALCARASRAYCLGVQFKEIDNEVTRAEVFRLYNQITKTKKVIKNQSFLRKLEELGPNVIDTKNYAAFAPNVATSFIKN